MNNSAAEGESVASVRVLLSGRFRWFFIGRSIDIAGSSMTPVALALAILDVSGSPTDLGVVMAAQMVPYLVVVLLGGVLADRFDRRSVLIVANLGSAATQGGIALVLLTGNYSLPAVAALSLASGVLTAFTTPALRGIIPELVPVARIQQANALLASCRNAIRIAGPLVAGVLVAGFGGGWALAIDAVSYVMAALTFLRIGRSGRPTREGGHLIRDLRDGWVAFTSRRWVVVMTCSAAVMNAVNVGPWNVLGPLLVSRHSGDAAWGLVLSVRAAGLLVMSVVIYRVVLRRPLRTGRLWGTLSALPLLLLGVTNSLWLIAVATFVGGVGFTAAAVTWDTSLQQQVPPEVLSRVSSYDDLLSYLAIPLSQLLVGPFAARFGADSVAVVCGAMYAVASLSPLVQRDVRHQGLVRQKSIR